MGHLGPDTLGPDWDEERAVANLIADPTRAIGEVLLDQRVLAGRGQPLQTEVCFLRGLSPWTPVGEVADPRAVVRLAQRTLRANRDQYSQSTTGRHPQGRASTGCSSAPASRAGGAAPGSASAMQGEPPRERITYWCPPCQPGPAPAPGEAPVPPRPLGRPATDA